MRQLLARPVQRLHFAGEATSSPAPATAHGALMSGRRAAKEVLGAGAKSVVVVGSGFSGTACARQLADNGVKVTMLEGRDRVGGRIWTSEIVGVPAELGASWIHGSGKNPMTDVLNATGDARYPFDYEKVAGRDEAAYDKMAEYQKKLEDVEQPYNTPISAVFPKPLPPDVQYAATVTYSWDFGADIDQLAVFADDEGDDMLGPDLLLPDGYNRLLGHVRGDIQVRTGAEVTAVRQHADGVTLALRSGGTVTADRVVLTVPIGVLKAGSITFDPPLPPEKTQAIDALGAGLLDKLWLEFPEVFWDHHANTLEWYDHRNPGLWAMWVNGYKVWGKPVLLGFNAGRRAHDLAHASDQEVVASAMNALRNMQV